MTVEEYRLLVKEVADLTVQCPRSTEETPEAMEYEFGWRDACADLLLIIRKVYKGEANAEGQRRDTAKQETTEKP